jgi:endogenous inhibitor of DNA gyrase (YacG/DUF329 family)
LQNKIQQMAKRNIIKKCPECGNDFEAARLNQIFCDTTCKMYYNNRNAMAKYHERNEEDLVTREVNKVLYKNRKILKKYAGQEVGLKIIEAEGFRNQYITSFRQEEKKMVFMCYDIAYVFLSETTIQIGK